MPRTLREVIDDQERAFRELVAAEQDVAGLNRAGRQPGLIDGLVSDLDRALERLHDAQHRLDALCAEALHLAMEG